MEDNRGGGLSILTLIDAVQESNADDEADKNGSGGTSIRSCSEKTTFRGDWSGKVKSVKIDRTGEVIPPGRKVGWDGFGLYGEFFNVWTSLEGTVMCEEMCRGRSMGKKEHQVAVSFPYKLGLGAGYKFRGSIAQVVTIFKGVHAGVKNAWFIASHLGEFVELAGDLLVAQDRFRAAAGAALQHVILRELYREKVVDAACRSPDKTGELIYQIRQTLADL